MEALSARKRIIFFLFMLLLMYLVLEGIAFGGCGLNPLICMLTKNSKFTILPQGI